MSLRRKHHRIRNLKRYQHIVGVLIKHGFYDFVDHSNLLQYVKFRERFLPGKKFPKGPTSKLSHWERIRFVLEDLGPAFVKLGQFLSNRTDILPKELCAELEKLLDSVSPFDGKIATRTVEEAFKKPVSKLFRHFDHDPVSSASISQVHVAVLENGDKVAVKIRRPKVREEIDTDLEIMRNLASLMERFVEGMEVLRPSNIIDDFETEVDRELDFKNEALNIAKFARLNQGDRRVKVPRVYKELTCESVLTMEYIDGAKLSHLDLKPEITFDPTIITDRIGDLVLLQFFEFGFFHGDPHSANVMILPDNVVCFIDFGLMGILPPQHMQDLSEIIAGLSDHDSERITEAVIALSMTMEVENRRKLDMQVFRIVEEYAYIPLRDINIGNFLSDLLRVIIDNKLRLPSDIYLLLKALISLEGTVRKIKPDFDMMSHVKPFVKRLMYERNNPLQLLKSLYSSGIKYTRLFQEIPLSVIDIS